MTLPLLTGIFASVVGESVTQAFIDRGWLLDDIARSSVMNGIGTVLSPLGMATPGYWWKKEVDPRWQPVSTLGKGVKMGTEAVVDIGLTWAELKLAKRAAGYALSSVGAKAIGETLLQLAPKAGVFTAFLSLPGMPLNATPLGAGTFEASIEEFAQGKMIAGGDEIISTIKIYSDDFARILGNPDYNHAPRLALETAILLKELGYLKKPIQASDKNWDELIRALGTGTLEQYLGGLFPGGRRDTFISAVREGLIAFQKNLFDRGIKVKIGQFDAETCRQIILSYNAKVAAPAGTVNGK